MIKIDSHTHYGKIAGFDCSIEKLNLYVEKNNINTVIVSDISSIEYDSNLNKLLNNIPSIDINKNLKKVFTNITNKIKYYGLYWIKPDTDENISDIFNFLKENNDFFKGLKIHPYHSRLKINDKKYFSYYRLARELDMPIAIHTADDPYSQVNFIENIIENLKNIPIILVHCGLNTDHRDAIKLMKKYSNIYGDTTWVCAEDLRNILKEISTEKIVYGSDAPIGFDNIDRFYKEIEKMIIKHYGNKAIEDIYSKNPAYIFKI